MNIQYSVEFRPVKFTKYKLGAPKHLLKKVGRWQESGPYGGWNNIDYVPDILTDNKSAYECAPEMLKALESHIKLLDELYASDVSDVSPEHITEFQAVHGLVGKTKALLEKAQGVSNE